LGHGIKHAILYKQGLPVRFLEVSVSDGAATLHGAANSQALVDAAESAARETAGSVAVRNEIQVIREYGLIP
jgi:osmotically-inducible protein OsmY